jgi:hypothetical protein
MPAKQFDILWLFLCVPAAVLVKLGLSAWGAVPFNSDEAVVGLMARHILQGERPIFFYGQAYMGSLDAWLTAGAFRLLGESVMSIRILQAGLYAIYIILVWLTARRFLLDQRSARIAVLLAAVPPVYVTTYTIPSLGGYGESLILGTLILLLSSVGIYEVHRRTWLTWTGLGLASGLAFWTLGMAAVYLLPVGLAWLWAAAGRPLIKRLGGLKVTLHRYEASDLPAREPAPLTPARRLAPVLFVALPAFLLGALPWLVFNLTHQWEALRVLLVPNQAELNPGQNLLAFIGLGLPSVMGFRFPWTFEYAPLPILLAGLLLHLAALTWLVNQLRNQQSPFSPGGGQLTGLFVFSFFSLFIFTRFGSDPTGRYLLPLHLPLLLGLAAFISAAWKWRRGAGISLVVCLLLLNGFETARAAFSPDRITTQFNPVTRFDNQHDEALMNFLRQQDERHGYTHYWAAFRLAFLSQEEIIFAPLLPYRTDLRLAPGDNRYPAYAEAASGNSQAAYITTHNPALDDLLRKEFARVGSKYSETLIGPYRLFYAVTPPVHLKEFLTEEWLP